MSSHLISQPTTLNPTTLNPTTSNPTTAQPVPTNPPISLAPSGTVFALTTPEPCDGSTCSYASAKGTMFDVVAKGSQAIRVLSMDLFFKVSQCDYMMWSRLGDSSLVIDDPDAWDLIGEGTLTLTGTPAFGHRETLSGFTPQVIPAGQTRAFYIAFLDCTGDWPLAVDAGDNYLEGVAAEDDNMAIMEGIKKGSISSAEPISPSNFGSNYYCCCQPGPGNGCSHTMRGSTIKYDFNGDIVTPAPTPTVPTTSNPTASTPNPTTANPTPAPTRTLLACGTSDSDNTANYEPASMSFCGTEMGTGGGKWYTVTGATPGQTVTLTTCNQASYDTKISLWGDSNTCLAGNDDKEGCSGYGSTVTYTSDGTDTDALVQ